VKKYLGNYLLQLCPKVVKHPVFECLHDFVGNDWKAGQVVWHYKLRQ